jgi:hypothetical protein
MEEIMAKVIGIGRAFFKSRNDNAVLRAILSATLALVVSGVVSTFL